MTNGTGELRQGATPTPPTDTASADTSVIDDTNSAVSKSTVGDATDEDDPQDATAEMRRKGGGAAGELSVTARRGTAYTAGTLLNGLLQFLFLALITHLIAQSDVGALLEAIAIFTIGSNAAELGADTGLLRMMPVYRSRRPQDLRRLAQVATLPALVASAIIGALIYVYAPQLSNVFVHHAPRAGTTSDLRILAFFLPAATESTVILAGLRTWSARQPVILNNFVTPIARPLLFAAFLLIGTDAKLALLAWTIPIALAFGLAVAALLKRLRDEPDRLETSTANPISSRRSVAREFWSFSAPRTFGAIFQILITFIDVLLVGAYLSAKSAAAYSVASRYVIFSTFALGAVVSAVGTQLSRLMDAGAYDKATDVYKSSTAWTAAASWPPLLVLAIFAPLFMTVFGHGYRTGEGALTILALGMLVNIGTGPNGLLLLMAGRSRVNLILQALGLATNVGLNLWLIPLLGLAGAAIAWAATILITSTMASLLLWRSFRIEPFSRGYLLVCASAAGCFGVLGLSMRLAFGTGLPTFIVFAVVSCSLYAFIIYKGRSWLQLDAFESIYARLLKRRHPPIGPKPAGNHGP